jgi:hypothetical protein
MLRLIFTIAALFVGAGMLAHLPTPVDVVKGLQGLLPPPEVVAAEIRKVMPPPDAFGGPGQAVQPAHALPSVYAQPPLPVQTRADGKGLVVFEIPQPAKQAPVTPYLGSLKWINGE